MSQSSRPSQSMCANTISKHGRKSQSRSQPQAGNHAGPSRLQSGAGRFHQWLLACCSQQWWAVPGIDWCYVKRSRNIIMIEERRHVVSSVWEILWEFACGKHGTTLSCLRCMTLPVPMSSRHQRDNPITEIKVSSTSPQMCRLHPRWWAHTQMVDLRKVLHVPWLPTSRLSCEACEAAWRSVYRAIGGVVSILYVAMIICVWYLVMIHHGCRRIAAQMYIIIMCVIFNYDVSRV